MAFFEALGTLRAEYERVVAENRALQPTPLEKPSKTEVAVKKAVPKKETKEINVKHQDAKGSNFDGRHVGFEVPQGDGDPNATEKKLPEMRRSVFRSAEDVASSLRPILNGVEEKNYTSGSTCAQIALHPHFQTMDMVMILVYAIWMGIDADWNSALLITDAHAIFQLADHFFCIYFVTELILRFFAYQGCRDRLRDAWFVFDAILVPLTIFDTWVMTILALATPVDQREATFVRRTEILRSFRILRLTRICRMAKLVRFFPELQILIKAPWCAGWGFSKDFFNFHSPRTLGKGFPIWTHVLQLDCIKTPTKAMLTAFRSVFFALILLLASHYMIAIAYHVTLQDSEIGKVGFASVLASMQTLFVHCTMLDEVISLVDQFTAESLYFHLLCMYLVMFLNAITLMNILIGIVVEVISNVAMAEREMVNVRWVQDVINQFLGDDVESLKQSELMEILASAKTLGSLKLLGVDAAILQEMVLAHFKEDQYASEMPLQHFVELVMQLRGANTASVKDVVDLRKCLADLLDAQHHYLQQISRKMDETMAAKPRAPKPLTGRKKKAKADHAPTAEGRALLTKAATYLSDSEPG